MTKHTESQNHNDVVSLREYIEDKFCLIEKATDLANRNLEIRLEGLNEWRQQNQNERNMFLSKDVYESKHENLRKQVEDLKLNRALLEGKASQQSVFWAYLISGIGLLMGLYQLFK
jgi:hypothetical protein